MGKSVGMAQKRISKKGVEYFALHIKGRLLTMFPTHKKDQYVIVKPPEDEDVLPPL